MSSWVARGTLPLATALAAVAAFALPARAQVSMSTAASPGLASEWWLTSLNAQQAWGSAPGQGAGVTVSVLSTGVDPSQPDLAGNVTSGPDYSRSGRGQGNPWWGAEGTAIASLIAGHGHGAGGAQGITGIAPRARVLSVRVTLEQGDPLADHADLTRHLPVAIARGIRYAVSHGAKVIVLPPDPATLTPSGASGTAPANGVPGNSASGNTASGDSASGDSASGDNGSERAAVREAIAHGVILVAPAGDTQPAGNTVPNGNIVPNGAAGMSGGGMGYPAAYPGVIAVGATGADGKLAPFSSTTPDVALTAPGAGLAVSAPGGGYATLSSTTLASALTAGVAALAVSRYPGLTADQITQAMEHGAVPASPGEPGTGAGALNAAGTITAAASTFSLIGNPMPNPAPAWNQYLRSRGRNGTGLLGSTAFRAAAAGTGAIVVLALLLVFTSRRRRLAESRDEESLETAPWSAEPWAEDDGPNRRDGENGGSARGGSHTWTPDWTLPAAPLPSTPEYPEPTIPDRRASADDGLPGPLHTRALRQVTQEPPPADQPPYVDDASSPSGSGG